MLAFGCDTCNKSRGQDTVQFGLRAKMRPQVVVVVAKNHCSLVARLSLDADSGSLEGLSFYIRALSVGHHMVWLIF